MPTYEYRCASCGQHIEIVQSFTDDPLTECGACQGLLRKVFSPVGIVFKGSGFYKTDSRSGSKSAALSEARSESKSESRSESKSESSSDSKSDSKKDSSKSDSSSSSSRSSTIKDAKIA